MLRKVVLVGLAGSVWIAPLSIKAQEAAPQPTTSECSGLACLFGQSVVKPQPVAAQPQPEPPPAVVPAPETGNSAGDGNTKVDTRKRERPRRAKLKPRPPVHVVTIAADAAEIGRLKHLTEVMPKPPVKLVRLQDERAAADMSVVARLDAPPRDGTRLFVEQLHIVASGKIKSVADLAGKSVSFGPAGGASQAAARTAFAALGVGVKETPLDLDNALDGVGTGDIAAVVLLAPQPDARLTQVSGLHLVAWPDGGKLPEGGVVTTIEGSGYPKLAAPGDKIRAVGVDAVLKASARGARDPATRTFLAALSQHAAGLKRHGFDRLADDGAARTFASRERR